MSAPEKPEDQDFSGFAEALKLTEKAVSDTPVTDTLRKSFAGWASVSDMYDAMVMHANQLERDRTRLIEALVEFLEPEHLRTYEQFKQCLDRARALMEELK